MAADLERTVVGAAAASPDLSGASVQAGPAFIPWLAGPVAVGLGVTAHLVSGGPVPPVSVLLALTALVSMIASLVASPKVPGWALLVLSGVIQQALHLAFDVLAGGPGEGQGVHSHVITFEAISAPISAGAGEHLSHVMLFTHMAAALLTAFLLSKAGATILKTRENIKRRRQQ